MVFHMSNALTAHEINEAKQEMSPGQACEWLANLSRSVARIAEGKGVELTEQTTGQITSAFLAEMLERGDQGRRIARNTVAAMILDAEARGPEAWEA